MIWFFRGLRFMVVVYRLVKRGCNYIMCYSYSRCYESGVYLGLGELGVGYVKLGCVLGTVFGVKYVLVKI